MTLLWFTEAILRRNNEAESIPERTSVVLHIIYFKRLGEAGNRSLPSGAGMRGHGTSLPLLSLGVPLETETLRAPLPGPYKIRPSFGADAAEHILNIARSALFAGLTPADHKQIAQCSRARDFARHDSIFEQGEPIRNIFLILAGSVKLTQLSCSGTEVILWLCGTSDAVGVFGIPSQVRHTCSARVVVKCRALVWDWSRLDRLAASVQIRKNIGALTSNRIGELEVRFREIATEKVSVRVGLELLRIARHIGRPVVGGIEVTLSREELAQLTATTLFTISRLISRWSEQGLTIARREAIILRDPIRLLEACSKDEQ